MRKALIITLFSLGLYSCGGIKTLSRGLESDSFLEFVGKPSNYGDGVEVKVDSNPIFKAEVNKKKDTKVRGTVYAISTGQHNLKVFSKSQLIYQKQIFVTAQETKTIELP